ncbi:MAG: PEP-CTERM sorting domain-containing protein [Akkermansia sp.]|nr:PEP-CTERM sorting domain-containing protein [Akkermansia sp.]
MDGFDTLSFYMTDSTDTILTMAKVESAGLGDTVSIRDLSGVVLTFSIHAGTSELADSITLIDGGSAKITLSEALLQQKWEILGKERHLVLDNNTLKLVAAPTPEPTTGALSLLALAGLAARRRRK